MKKVFFFLLLLFFGRRLSPVLAQEVGYNIVNNFFDEENKFNEAAFRALQKEGAVTVRITGGDLAGHPDLIEQIQGAAEKYDLQLIWQPEDWSATTPQHFEKFWLPHLEKIKRGKISLFTEYNYHYGHPDYYAQILQRALTRLGDRVAFTNLNITNPSGKESPFGETMVNYQEFLSQIKERCPNCLEQVSTWAVSVYSQDFGGFKRQLKEFTDYLSGLGISLQGKKIIIPEAGLDPSLPFEERWRRITDFAAELTARQGEIAQILQQKGMTLSALTFLFMDDATGQQFLLVRDQNGQWQIVEYSQLGLRGGVGPAGIGWCDYDWRIGQLFWLVGKDASDIQAGVRKIALRRAKLPNLRPLAQVVEGIRRRIRPPSSQEKKRPVVSCRAYVEFYYCPEGSSGEPILLGEGERVWLEVKQYYAQMAAATYQVGDWVRSEKRAKSPGSTAVNFAGSGLAMAQDEGMTKRVLGESRVALPSCDQIRSSSASPMRSEPVYVGGGVTVNVPLAERVIEWVEKIVEGVKRLVPVEKLRLKRFLVIPVLHQPHVKAADVKLREEVFTFTLLPGQEEFSRKDALVEVEYKEDELKDKGAEAQVVPRAKGMEEAAEKAVKWLNPPGF